MIRGKRMPATGKVRADGYVWCSLCGGYVHPSHVGKGSSQGYASYCLRHTRMYWQYMKELGRIGRYGKARDRARDAVLADCTPAQIAEVRHLSDKQLVWYNDAYDEYHLCKAIARADTPRPALHVVFDAGVEQGNERNFIWVITIRVDQLFEATPLWLEWYEQQVWERLEATYSQYEESAAA
jgi:hypothetical protein